MSSKHFQVSTLRIKGFLRPAGAALLMLVSPCAPLFAQDGDSLGTPGFVSPLPALGSNAEDRARVAQLLGRGPLGAFLIRSPSSEEQTGKGLRRWSLVAPQFTSVWNSTLPFSLNEGSLWAGRGMNTMLTAGFRAKLGPVSVILAPELVFSQNLEVQTLPPPDSGRSLFSAPWHVGAQSADLPQRFGNERLLQLLPGQSTLSVAAGPTTFGGSTENQWWGPGIRNAIVMSNQAEGIPHLFLRTTRPLDTRLGRISAKWIVGGLSESLFFDTVSTNDVRSLSGIVATLQPAGAPNLTLGVSRAVYARVDGASSVPSHALDALTWWRPTELTLPDSLTTTADSARGRGHDQIFSLFGRWVFPENGFELYAEWARAALPTSPIDLLNEPEHTQGYTLGLQWAKPIRETSIVRLQSEVTYLEESAAITDRPGKSFYVSRSVVQGYTQRGRTIGAAIGPGASSQWLAIDYLAPTWQLGLLGGRIRWDNDAYYDKPGRIYSAHDVSVFGGVRTGIRLLGLDVTGEWLRGKRYNYLFQNPELEPFGNLAVDHWNSTLRLTITPLFPQTP